ncbi:hypothetical protein HC891_03980 [Candidatus Gracilibacteria bacterium]|nr:hypothetical protein [Candidatus Gracilibacteria bacterium]
MVAYNFRVSASNEAGGQAVDGRGKLHYYFGGPARSLTARAAATLDLEQTLLDQLVEMFRPALPQTLLTEFFVSLKTNPFVVLTGAEGAGKAALVEGFARSLVGRETNQFITISSGEWAQQTSQQRYFADIHERFGSLHFLEALQEAAAPGNLGKIYIVFLRGLQPDELHTYCSQLLRVEANGTKRLALPGVPLAQQPTLPPNIFIIATLHLSQFTAQLDDHVQRHATLIAFGPTARAPKQLPLPALPLPVGYQRVLLRAVVNHDQVAQDRLWALLSARELSTLQPSPQLWELLQQNGIGPDYRLDADMRRFIANSFDSAGHGLFDRENIIRNARIACDARFIQRILWRLEDPMLRQQLTAFLDDRYPMP